MTQENPNPGEIERKLNEYLEQDECLKQWGARVLPGTVRHEEWGWAASVGTESDPPRMFEYVDRLGAVSDRYKEQEHLDVLIAPSGIRPSEMNH